MTTRNGNGPAAIDLGAVKERQRAREALDDIELGTPEFGPLSIVRGTVH